MAPITSATQGAARAQARTVVAQAAPGAAARAHAAARGAAPRGEAPGRRAALLSLASLPLLTAPAWALLPAEDEDDEELVGLAKQRRKQRMSEERKVEESFVNKADYAGADVIRVQNAVNRLAKDGLSLEKGDLKAAASAGDAWVADFKKAVADLSSSPAAQKSSGNMLSSVDALSRSLQGGDLQQAKSSFVATVTALQGWIADAGLSNKIKGL